MSAVSSESPRAAANLSEPSSSQSDRANGTRPVNADFGANEWLVDELYQRYLADPGSVDRAWWSFFADYRPTRPGAATAAATTGTAKAGTAAEPASPEAAEAA